MNGEFDALVFGILFGSAGVLAAEWVEAVSGSHTLGNVVALAIFALGGFLFIKYLDRKEGDGE